MKWPPFGVSLSDAKIISGFKPFGCHGALDVFSGKGGWVVGEA